MAEKKYPTQKFKVLKNIKRRKDGGEFLRMDDDVEVFKKELLRWTTDDCKDYISFVPSGRMLAFSRYYYNIINAKNNEEKRESMIIVLSILDNGKCIENVEIHPFELNNLIKEDAIEII